MELASCLLVRLVPGFLIRTYFPSFLSNLYRLLCFSVVVSASVVASVVVLSDGFRVYCVVTYIFVDVR